MKRLIIDREVIGYVREYYDVEFIGEETIQKAINYELTPYSSEYLYDCQQSTGNCEVFDKDLNFIKQAFI